MLFLVLYCWTFSYYKIRISTSRRWIFSRQFIYSHKLRYMQAFVQKITHLSVKAMPNSWAASNSCCLSSSILLLLWLLARIFRITQKNGNKVLNKCSLILVLMQKLPSDDWKSLDPILSQIQFWRKLVKI